MPISRTVLLLILGALCLVVFAVAFGKIPAPEICGLFPFDKEDLVRHYACSLALCTKGCNSYEANNICLDMDCTAKTCKKTCNSFCETPPSSWGSYNVSWDIPSKVCGKKYNISLSLENRVALKGQYCEASNFLAGCTDWTTEATYIIKYLNKTEGFPLSIMEGGPYGSYDFIGELWTYKEEWVAVPPTPYNFAWIYQTSGSGDIYMDWRDSVEKFGCSGVSTISGYDQCLFQGNLNIYTSWKTGDNLHGDVYFNTSTPSPASFEIDATPCYGSCGDDCERIKKTDEACFDVRITNRLGTGSDFQLELDCISGPCAVIGCTEPCTTSFEENDFNVDVDGEKIIKLKFTPAETGTYNIWVTAEPTAAYESETDDLELRVVDFDIDFSDTYKEVKPGVHATYGFYIDNKLGNDDFQLSYSCPGCTCQFQNGQPTYTVNLGVGISPFTIECWSGTKDTYSINLHALAVNESLPKDTDPDATLKVTGCTGDISLSVSSPVVSGDSITLSASNLDGCGSVPVQFSLNGIDSVFGSCSGNTGCPKTYTANSPGTSYTVYAMIDLDGDDDYSDENETDFKLLEIREPARSDGTMVPNTEGTIYHCCADCVPIFSVAHMCQRCCGTGNLLVCNSQDCGDSQSCGIWSSLAGGYVTSYHSNICCTSGYDNHSSGPGTVPCLTTDTRNDHERTRDFYFSGYVQNPKNFYDALSWTTWNGKTHEVHSPYTYFEHQAPGSKDDCYGGAGAPQPLQDLKNYVDWVDSPWGKNCEFTGSSEDEYVVYYGKSWIFLRIAPSDESRPVYGIEGSFYTYTGNLINVLLHKKTGEWIHIGSISDAAGGNIIRPSGKWSWSDIDSMLLGFGQDSGVGYLYHLGILTKGPNTFFCTDGSTNEYYRTVDDGKKCYYGVDCPLSGNAWDYSGPGTGVGPFKETKSCDCSSGSCGNGLCQDGDWCYYNVTCMNGGWSSNYVKCSGTCTASGCS